MEGAPYGAGTSRCRCSDVQNAACPFMQLLKNWSERDTLLPWIDRMCIGVCPTDESNRFSAMQSCHCSSGRNSSGRYRRTMLPSALLPIGPSRGTFPVASAAAVYPEAAAFIAAGERKVAPVIPLTPLGGPCHSQLHPAASTERAARCGIHCGSSSTSSTFRSEANLHLPRRLRPHTTLAETRNHIIRSRGSPLRGCCRIFLLTAAALLAATGVAYSFAAAVCKYSPSPICQSSGQPPSSSPRFHRC